MTVIRVTVLEPGVDHHALAGVGADSRAVGAEDARLRHRRKALAHPEVEVVERRSPQLDQHLAVAGDGIRRVLVSKNLRSAVVVYPDGLHRVTLSGVNARELERLGAEVGLDVVGAARAEPYDETERHIRERRARGLFADMRFTMAQPEVSCHPERLLPNARTVVSAALCYYAPGPEPEAGEGRLPRYTWDDATPSCAPSSSSSAAARRRVPRPRRREPARRPRRRLARRHWFLRQEHAADHATLRLVGRPRDARDRRRDRAVVAARRRLRLVPTLHRRLPDGRARRAGDARLDALPLLLDAVAGRDPGGVPRAARGPRLRLRHLPGRLSVEPRRREAPCRRARARRGGRLARRLASEDGDTLRERYDRLYVPRNDPRFLRRNALVAVGNTGGPEHLDLLDGFEDDELLAPDAAWARARIEERSC